jgi:hypothetical protein
MDHTREYHIQTHKFEERLFKLGPYKGLQLYNNLRRNDEFQNITTVNGFQHLAKSFVRTI